MTFFATLRSPRDPRWQGFQRHHHTLFLIKNVILFIFMFLIIVEGFLFLRWWNHDNETSIEYAPYHFWIRIGWALIADVVYTLATLALIHQKLPRVLKLPGWNFHPAVALTFSILLFAAYPLICFFNILIAWSNEVSFHNSNVWYQLAFVEAGVQGVLGLCYLGMMICSCVAVHRWRKAQGGGYLEGREGQDRFSSQITLKARKDSLDTTV